MIKAIIAAAAVLVILFMGGDIKITLRPFSFSMPNWLSWIGWGVMAIGIIILRVDARQKAAKEATQQGYDAGYNKCKSQILEIIQAEQAAQHQKP